ncbi:FadR/GntR family transcriptional regulator [Devriesea agamarum]|uniref:FadR/GntR family transcriptional regulator n=1 Tax=Devriesea agamarum TaxID=472569 RepID=UPI00071C3EB7|nr:FadR/GntR family transcriptional regulator [Devriesea agamarum]
MAVTDQAIAAIKQMIVDGTLKAGDRLPPEKELSETLGLSRNSLREAVKALELINVLDVRQGDGTYVTSLSLSLLLEAMSFVLDLHSETSAMELLAVRRILEPEAVALAAARISRADLTRLEHLVDSLVPESDIELLVDTDLSFHRIINEACGNPYLSSLLDGLANSTVRARLWNRLKQSNAVEKALDEHRAILDALHARRADLARTWACLHISGIELWLTQAARPPHL